MSISVQRLGILEQMPRNVNIEGHGKTVRQLINQLSDCFGSEVEELLLENDHLLRQGLCVLLNGRSITSLNGLNTVLQDGDEIFITIICAGG